MKVFIIEGFHDSCRMHASTSLEGIFSTKEKANEVATLLRDKNSQSQYPSDSKYKVREIELDELPWELK